MVFDPKAFARALADARGDRTRAKRPAKLGNPTNALVRVPDGVADQTGLVYIHAFDGSDPTAVATAMVDGLPDERLIYGLDVLTETRNGRKVVVGQNEALAAQYTKNVYTNMQRTVRQDQADFGLLRPVSNRMYALVSAGTYRVGDNVYIVDDLVTKDFTSDIPGTGGQARLVLVMLIPSSGVLNYTNGSTFAQSTYANARAAFDGSQAPAIPNSSYKLCGYIYLYNGMTAITRDEILSTHEVLGGGLIYTGTAPIDVTGSTISHDTTAVTPGSYTNADITVDATGHITAASNGSGGSGNWVLLEDDELTSAASSITIPSSGTISGSYTHLKLIVHARGTYSDPEGTEGWYNYEVHFNANTTGYSYLNYRINGGVNVTQRVNSASAIRVDGGMATADAPANIFGQVELLIGAYSDTAKEKTLTYHGSNEANGASNVNYMQLIQGHGHWNNTAAITSIILTPTSGNFVTGTRYSLYGLT